MEVWKTGGGETNHKRVWEKPSETTDEGVVQNGKGSSTEKGGEEDR